MPSLVVGWLVYQADGPWWVWLIWSVGVIDQLAGAYLDRVR